MLYKRETKPENQSVCLYLASVLIQLNLVFNKNMSTYYSLYTLFQFDSPAVLWPKYCRYGVKPHIINQSINLIPLESMYDFITIVSFTKVQVTLFIFI
mgnify:CR=1 FL=1